MNTQNTSCKPKPHHVDALILGGGIAGLWTLARLKKLGYHVILLEKTALGAGQTALSQGIIHGGSKFALTGKATQAALALKKVPEIWQKCLLGQGEIDLSQTRILSPYHYMWLKGQFSAKIKAFVSQKTLQADNKTLDKSQYPDAFQHANFNGQLCQLEENVIDVESLIEQFYQQYGQHCYLMPKHYHLSYNAQKACHTLMLKDQDNPDVIANHLILTAGAGNHALLADTQLDVHMQRRPLHMVLAKDTMLPSVYLHIVGHSNKPLATITTCYHQDGTPIWYIGGEVAEQGCHTSSPQLIKTTKNLLKGHFHWLDFSKTQWATCPIDRAEMKQKHHKRPDSFTLSTQHHTTVAWPTKLALAPLLARAIIDNLPPPMAHQHTQKPLNIAYALPSPMIWNQLL